MAKPSDIRVRDVSLYFLPVQTRVPLKFGPETLTSVTCARVRLEVEDRRGQRAVGWGETPLSVQWVWPSRLSYESRHQALLEFSRVLARAWAGFDCWGHPLELGIDFQAACLRPLADSFNQGVSGNGPHAEPMPWLAALVCCSAFDIALHDAYGHVVGRPVYSTYGPEFLNRDLADFLEPVPDADIRFAGRFPADYLAPVPRPSLRAWHLVGGLDPLRASDLTGSEPRDGYPVLLSDWIRRDGLRCLKVKLRGNDADWDYARLVEVGHIGLEGGVQWLSADYNCTVTDPEYVNVMLDRLRDAEPRLYGMLLYVEQPFPYDLERHRIDVRSVAARKPLFLDESAHEWRLVRLGRDLGWSGVALKTCKTQSGALLSGCWAQAHGMTLMVQDLSNPMLAQIPHVLLAAHMPTIMGVETNGMQFYPDASLPEAAVHAGLYRRRQGNLDLSSLAGAGFGYRLDAIRRPLPPADTVAGG
jgi:L-alanine-DL-glutamate epimerase-like enolase superfamily enzyme